MKYLLEPWVPSSLGALIDQRFLKSGTLSRFRALIDQESLGAIGAKWPWGFN